MLTTSAPQALRLKALDDSRGQFEGYASLYNVSDSQSDEVAPGAFTESLRDIKAAGRRLPVLWQHDQGQPLGVWHELISDRLGLFVRGQLFIHEVARAAEAYALLKRGALSGLSIGYQVLEREADRARGIQKLRRVKLYEISLVTFPALEAARVSAVKTLSPEAGLPAAIRALSATLQQALPPSFNPTIKE